MNDAPTAPLEDRVLILAPTPRDATLTGEVFGQVGIACHPCHDLSEICRELDRGAAAVILAEEAVIEDRRDRMATWLQSQPTWSDLPVLVLARPGADSSSVARAMDMLGNVTVLERPIRVAALVSAVRTALSARRRQYQIREHLTAREIAASELFEAGRRKDEFLAILAHELRNPLAPILNSLQILRMTGASDPGITHISEVMERQVKQMVRLVDDLLEVSRITVGKIKLQVEQVELEPIIQNALEASRPLIDANAHHVVLEIPSEKIILDADQIRLVQVFANLLNNAAKYTPRGGQIAIKAQRDGSKVRITVSDNGTGIPGEMLPKVFDLFTQVARGPDRSQGGLGIGLTMVKGLVEIQGGSVSVQSAGLGRGSQFTVTLPVLDVIEPEKARTVAKSANLPFQHQRIMIVDDNHDAADSLAQLLKLMGAEVRVTYDGRTAMDLAEQFLPQTMILDIGMPGMDGREVARQLRARKVGQDLKLIALTGWGQEADVQLSRLAGFDYHLTKPANLQKLRGLLENSTSA